MVCNNEGGKVVSMTVIARSSCWCFPMFDHPSICRGIVDRENPQIAKSCHHYGILMVDQAEKAMLGTRSPVVDS